MCTSLAFYHFSFSSVGGLSAIVLGSPVVKEHLGPALLESYVAVDTVEGVDVDKEDFEKYGARLALLLYVCGL